MYFWNRSKRLTVDGQKVWLDISTGKFGPTGDVCFSTTRGTTFERGNFDWSASVEAAPGGGLMSSKDDLMFEAPEAGYQTSWTHEVSGKDPMHPNSKSAKFYLKAPGNKYAVIVIEFNQMYAPEADVDVTAYVNPSGSRNLQFDSHKSMDLRR